MAQHRRNVTVVRVVGVAAFGYRCKRHGYCSNMQVGRKIYLRNLYRSLLLRVGLLIGLGSLQVALPVAAQLGTRFVHAQLGGNQLLVYPVADQGCNTVHTRTEVQPQQ